MNNNIVIVSLSLLVLPETNHQRLADHFRMVCRVEAS